MASGRPAARAYSSISAMPSCTCVHAAAMSFEGVLPGRENCGSPPTTSTMQDAPSALASSPAPPLSARVVAGHAIRDELTAPAAAGEIKSGVAHRAPGAIEPDGGDLVAPGIDGADAVAGAGVDDREQIALLADRRRVQRQPAMIGREIAHQTSKPRVARNAFIRWVAASGLASSPALSARRNSSARCKVERALSCPPTMVK